jgi:hypothetical protein
MRRALGFLQALKSKRRRRCSRLFRNSSVSSWNLLGGLWMCW